MDEGSETSATTAEGTYEDGRKGAISATLDIRDAAVQTVSSQIAAQ